MVPAKPLPIVIHHNASIAPALNSRTHFPSGVKILLKPQNLGNLPKNVTKGQRTPGAACAAARRSCESPKLNTYQNSNRLCQTKMFTSTICTKRLAMPYMVADHMDVSSYVFASKYTQHTCLCTAGLLGFQVITYQHQWPIGPHDVAASEAVLCRSRLACLSRSQCL